jgi:hypothetical protein
MGGDPLTGEPHFVEAVYRGKDAIFPMPLNVSFDEETGGALMRNFDGYVLPLSEIQELFELALRAADANGEQEILRHNRETAAGYNTQQALLENQRRAAPKRIAQQTVDEHPGLLGHGVLFAVHEGGPGPLPRARADRLDGQPIGAQGEMGEGSHRREGM